MSLTALMLTEKRLKHVNAWNYDEQMLVQAGVGVTDEREMGILVRIFDENDPEKSYSTVFWGLLQPHDLITCWRGMLILQELDTLHQEDLSGAYYAGKRNPNEGDMRKISRIVYRIGLDYHAAIMAMRVPDEVINLIIRHNGQGGRIALQPITEEIRAGTISWTDELGRLGVVHPDRLDERRQAEEEVIERYETHLVAYAQRSGIQRNSRLMKSIEDIIVVAVERGVEAQHGVDVVLGLAIARAHGNSAAAAAILELHSDAEFARSVNVVIRNAAQWVSSRFDKGWLWRSNPSRRQYETIIRQLIDDWGSMPVTHPLLPA